VRIGRYIPNRKRSRIEANKNDERRLLETNGGEGQRVRAKMERYREYMTDRKFRARGVAKRDEKTIQPHNRRSAKQQVKGHRIETPDGIDENKVDTKVREE
jgi:hypothetical protein